VDVVMQSLVKGFQQAQDLKGLREDEAFEAFAGFCVLGSFYEDEFPPDAFRIGGGGDHSIDVFGILVNGELLRDSADVRAAVEQAKKLDAQVIVIQAKTSPRFEEKVIAGLADDLMDVVGSEPMNYQASPDIHNMRDCLTAIYADLAKLAGKLPGLHIRYVTTGQEVADGVQRKIRQAERRLSGPGLFATVDFRCVTGRELKKLYRQATEAVPASFEMVKKIALPRIPGVEQAMLGLLSAPTLIDHVLTDPTGGIRESLFYDNVRPFQGYNDVNSKIRDTLRDPERRKRFAVLNNGITIVTRELTVAGDDVQIRDFQIVNGCQTCYVLFDEKAQLTDSVQVSVRLIHSQDEDVIGGIVAATNLQTAVSEEVLAGRADFHKDLEEYFACQPADRRLYYERRPRQYSARDDVTKARVITMSQLTRAYLATFLGEPDRAGRRDTLDRRGDDLFRSDHSPTAYYAAAAAHYRLEALLRSGRIRAEFRSARYHILSAMKMRILGPGPLPQAPKKAANECEKLLDLVWNQPAAERLAIDIQTVLQRVINAERTTGASLSELARTRRFADHMRREILGAASK
jgi:hypothetical protein